MRKFAFLLLMFIANFYPNYCEAESTYYFEGVVSNLFYDGAGILSQEGIKIGDYVYASFRVNFDEDGYYILNNGEKVVPKDPSMTNNPYWYFFSTLLTGTLLPVVNGGFNNDPEDISEYHIGYYNSGPIGNRGALQGGTGNSYFTIMKEGYTDTRVENWAIGENLKGIIVSYNNEDCSVMWADMTLTKIGQYPSIPRKVQPIPTGILNLLLLE